MNAEEAARLDGAIAAIAADPRWWRQGEWRCGTGMCLAGHIAVRAGGRWLNTEVAHNEADAYLVPEPEDAPIDVTETWTRPDGCRDGVHAASRALRLIGLPPFEDGGLFDAGNTVEDLRRRAAEVKGLHLEPEEGDRG